MTLIYSVRTHEVTAVDDSRRIREVRVAHAMWTASARENVVPSSTDGRIVVIDELELQETLKRESGASS